METQDVEEAAEQAKAIQLSVEKKNRSRKRKISHPNSTAGVK